MDRAYQFEAKAPSGAFIDGLVFAPCYDDAIYHVRAALRLEPMRLRLDVIQSLARLFGPREPTRDIIRLYRTIAERKKIGRSIPTGLAEAMDYCTDRLFVSRLQVMRQAMLDGETFANAMQKAGLPETDVQAVRAVQSAGKEGEVLHSIATRMGAEQELRRGIASIIWYPIFVLVVMWVVAWGITLFIAPKLGEFFEQISALQVALPTYARNYYAFATWFATHALIGSLVWFAVPVGVYSFARSRWTGAMLDRIPALYHLSMKSDLVSIFASLALSLSAGVRPVEAFSSVAKAARREDNRERLRQMAAIYRSGNLSIGRAVQVCEFPRYVQGEIAAGESAHNTSQGMRNCVELMSQDLERHMDQVKRLATIASSFVIAVFLLGFIFLTLYPQISATMSRL